MFNTRYNDVSPIGLASAPFKEPAMRGRLKGRGKERSRGIGCRRVATVDDEVPNKYVPVNENPSAHEEITGDDQDFENVEVVEQEEGGKAKAIGIPPIYLVLDQPIILFFKGLDVQG